MNNSIKAKDWPWKWEIDPSFYQEKNTWPAISVVIPSYNQGAFLEKTIRSILMQNYPNLELIVIDGGSTDHSVEIIQKYENYMHYWVSEKDRGQANAINKGLSQASGKILYWINSDDYLLPKALYNIGSFDWQQDTGAVVGIGHKVDIHDRIKYTPKVPELSYEAFLRWVGYGNFMQPACFFASTAWQECGPLNEELHFCLDVDLWLKIVQKFKFSKINEALAHAYIHPGAKTTKDFDKMKAETALLIAGYSGGFHIAREMLYDEFERFAFVRRVLNFVKRIRSFFKI